METTKNKLTPDQKEFFDKLKNYINLPIYFYGSIQRNDYFPGKSDFDIDIFTDNETSTIYQLCNFLNLKKSDFKKSVYKINDNVIYGYKVKYKDETKQFKIEMGLYDEKFKEIVMKDHLKDFDLPLYMSVILIIIKWASVHLLQRTKILKSMVRKRLKKNQQSHQIMLAKNQKRIIR